MLASFLGGIIIMKITNVVVNIVVPRVMIFDNEFYVLAGVLSRWHYHHEDYECCRQYCSPTCNDLRQRILCSCNRVCSAVALVVNLRS